MRRFFATLAILLFTQPAVAAVIFNVSDQGSDLYAEAYGS